MATRSNTKSRSFNAEAKRICNSRAGGRCQSCGDGEPLKYCHIYDKKCNHQGKSDAELEKMHRPGSILAHCADADYVSSDKNAVRLCSSCHDLIDKSQGYYKYFSISDMESMRDTQHTSLPPGTRLVHKWIQRNKESMREMISRLTVKASKFRSASTVLPAVVPMTPALPTTAPASTTALSTVTNRSTSMLPPKVALSYAPNLITAHTARASASSTKTTQSETSSETSSDEYTWRDDIIFDSTSSESDQSTAVTPSPEPLPSSKIASCPIVCYFGQNCASTQFLSVVSKAWNCEFTSWDGKKPKKLHYITSSSAGGSTPTPSYCHGSTKAKPVPNTSQSKNIASTKILGCNYFSPSQRVPTNRIWQHDSHRHFTS